LAETVKRHGVELIFGQSIPSAFILALPAVGIRQIGYRTENAGGIMADGYARISGRVGVVCAQNGPAATLLVPPFAEALKASIPLVGIVQDVPRSFVDRHAFQEIDHIALFQGCTKWARRVDRADRIEDYVDMAFTAATSGRPGPVALMVPMDLLREPAASRSHRTANLGSYPLDRPTADPAQITRAIAMLRAAERPIIVAGGGVHLSGAAAELVAFAEAAGIPVATSNMGKGVIAEDHPLALGVFTSNLQRGNRAGELADFLTGADAVFLIGTRTNQNGTDSWKTYPTRARFIHLDIDPQEIGRNYEALRLVGDARSTLRAMTDMLAGTRARDISALGPRLTAARVAVDDYVAEKGVGSEGKLRPEHLMRVISKYLTADDVLVADASYSSNWITTYVDARRHGQRFVVPRGLAGLGWGLPLALGAKLARPGARVVAVVGDGGFGHCWQELETARRIGVCVTVILLNNAILGFQYHAENVHYGFHSNAVDFTKVDHAAIARACGCNGVCITRPEDFAAAFTASLSARETTLIEVMTDPDAYPPISLFDGKSEATVTSTKQVQA
jgi:acetolactate synthase-1/2/3 large subunit